MLFSQIHVFLRCFMSFRLRCERMRFYVVFGGTCSLEEIPRKHLHLDIFVWIIDDI